jgi:hypothetical protein
MVNARGLTRGALATGAGQHDVVIHGRRLFGNGGDLMTVSSQADDHGTVHTFVSE